MAGDEDFALLNCDEDLEYRARQNLLNCMQFLGFETDMPLIEVKWFKGRDKETKARTIRALTDAMCKSVGCSPDAVTIIIQDVERYDWGRGGNPYE